VHGKEIKYKSFAANGIVKDGLATVNRDISCLRNQAKTNIKRYVDERLGRKSMVIPRR
jgi:hypothetical protein